MEQVMGEQEKKEIQEQINDLKNRLNALERNVCPLREETAKGCNACLDMFTKGENVFPSKEYQKTFGLEQANRLCCAKTLTDQRGDLIRIMLRNGVVTWINTQWLSNTCPFVYSSCHKR